MKTMKLELSAAIFPAGRTATARRHKTRIGCVAAAMLVGACAAPGPEPKTPQEWAAAFDGHHFATANSARKDLDSLMRRFERLCDAEHGQGRFFDQEVSFKNMKQPPNRVTQQKVPQFMVCLHLAATSAQVAQTTPPEQGEPAWGAKMAVEVPTWLNSVIVTGSTDYYGLVRMRYLDGAQAQGELDRFKRESQQAMQEIQACSDKVAAAKVELQNRPKVGLEFEGGTVIDVRMPLVEVQYSAGRRSANGVAREWIRADKLRPRVGC